MYAESLASRAEDAFISHVNKFGLQEHSLVSSMEDELSSPFDPSMSFTAAEQSLGQMELVSSSMSSTGLRNSVFPADFAVAELERAAAKLRLMKQRAAIAKQSFERATYESLNEQERLQVNLANQD